MTRRNYFLSLTALAVATSPFAQAVTTPPPHNLTDAQAQSIIQKFAEKETEFAKARDQYTFRQISKIIEYNDDRQAGRPVMRW